MRSSLKPSPQASHRLLQALREENRALLEQLRRAQALAELGTMTAMLVHEFNNIFTTTLGRAQLARDGDEASRDKAIRHTLDACNRAITICQALLDLTGGDARTTRTVPLVRLFRETLDAMARYPEKDGITLVQKVPPGLRVHTRPVELKQVLLNLLLNARAAVIAKGRGQSISLSALEDDGRLLIRVADTGVGIAPADLGRIFEPFFTTRNGSGGGSGLGLPVCQRIVESLGGRIEVRSQLGKGTVFTVILPQKPTRRSRKGR